MAQANWKITNNRFVALFDILGFKDLVAKNSHEATLKNLRYLKEIIAKYDNLPDSKIRKPYKLDSDQTKSITFSDTIIFFSKADTFQDLMKIIFDATMLLSRSIERGIPIKGGLSYGEITVDINQSLFFGQPIIDAYLLHEELQMITAIMDHNFETKMNSFPDDPIIQNVTENYKANLKSGKLTHTLLKPANTVLHLWLNPLRKMYNSTSGKSRLYIDNTIEFLESLQPGKKD